MKVRLTYLLAFLLIVFSANWARAQCTASFTYSVSGNTITVSSTSTGGASQWEFGDGNVGFGTSTSHTYSSSGTYTVCVLAIDFFGAVCATDCDSVTIGSGMSVCNADFGYSQSSGFVLFADSSTSTFPIVSRFWDFGDGNTSTSTNPSHTYAGPGTYVPCLTIVTNDSCVSTICDTIVVAGGGGCVASFTQSGSGNTIVFANTSTGTVGPVEWDFGDGNTTTIQNPTHTYAGPGTYTICLYVFSSPGNLCDSTCQTITILPPPTCQADFSWAASGLTVGFLDQSIVSGSVANWFWDFGDGGTSTVQNPTHTFNPGLYLVCLSIMTNDSCSSIYCDSVIVSTATCQAQWTAVTTGNDVTFTDNSSAGASTVVIWNWVFGDGSSSALQNPQHTYPGPGNWFTCLFITTQDSCIDSYCDTIVTNGPVGINPQTEAGDWQLYPNPAEEVCYISLNAGHSGRYSIQMLDVLGKEVFSQNYHVSGNQESTLRISIPTGLHGYYFIRVSGQEKYPTTKAIWIE